MATRSGKMAFTLRRMANFMKLFLKNGRATLGLGIILFFAFIALAAPLLTPYNSLGLDPERSGALAGRAVAPSWFRQLPQILGGDPGLSENTEPVPDPSLPRLWVDGGQLNYSIIPVDAAGNMKLENVTDVNYPYVVPGFNFPNKNGSLEVTFQRPTGGKLGGATTYIYRDFYWPYPGTISMYNGNLALLVKGSVKEIYNPLEYWCIVAIRGNAVGDPISGSLTLRVSRASGIHLAATADVSEYFDLSGTPRVRQKWVNEGYSTWQSWLNGTLLASGTELANGTILSSDVALPGHWNEMDWIVSSGSLTSKNYTQLQNSTYAWMYSDTGNTSYTGFWDSLEICDSNLTVAGNGPDIVRVANWTILETRTANASRAGSKKLYLKTNPFNNASWPDSLFDYRTVYYTIGSNETEEVVQYNGYGQNSLSIKQPLKYDHSANETVRVRAENIQLIQNIVLSRNTNLYVLLKVSLEDPYEVFKIQAASGGQIGPGSVTLYDENLKSYTTGILRVTGIETRLHVPVKVRLFLGRTGGNITEITLVRVLFPTGRYPTGFHVNATTGEALIDRPESGSEVAQSWIVARDGPHTEVSMIYNADPVFLQGLLSSTGTYRYALELTFVDKGNQNGTVTTSVYLDDFAIKLYGRAFGIMGSDQYGRDLYAQLIYGTRISLYLGLLVAVISVSIGLVVGLLAGYLGGAADQFLMRVNDLMLVLPGLPLMIVIVAVLGARIENLILLLGFLGWNGFARLVRSQVLSLKERPFIEAAKAAGAGTGHIVFRHVLPHVMALVYVSLATAVPGAITAEAALAWLGFFDPTRMSWGRMLHEVFQAGATRNWWWVIPPGLAISLVAVAFILLGFALDEILNPKLRLRK